MYSFKTDGSNSFPALTAPSKLVFLSNLSSTSSLYTSYLVYKVASVANLGKTFLAKGTAWLTSTFFILVIYRITRKSI